MEPPATVGYEGLGPKPSAAEHFFVILWSKSYFNAIGSQIATAQSHLKELDF